MEAKFPMRNLLLVLSLFLLVQSSQTMAKSPKSHQDSPWLLREKMRCISYVSPATAEVDLKRAHDLGFNSALYINTGYDIESAMPLFEATRKYQIHIFWVDYQRLKLRQKPVPAELTSDTLRFVSEDGNRFADDPCPLDSLYWEALLADRAVKLAKLAKEKYSFIGGFLTNLEDYDGSGLWDQYCFCGTCFQRFLRNRASQAKPPSDLPAHQRKDWLMAQNLLPDYERSAHQRMQKLLHGIRSRVDRFAPHFIFAAYPWPIGLWGRDIVLGLANKQVPFLFLSELTYSGYHPLSEEELGKFLEEKLPAVVVAGFEADSSTHLTPRALATNAYYGALRSQGYWIYVGSYPLLDAPAGRPTGPFLGTMDEWATEIKKVNGLIPSAKAVPPTDSPYPLLPIPERRKLRRVTSRDVAGHSPEAVLGDRPWQEAGLFWKGSELLLQANQAEQHLSFALPVTRKDCYQVLADPTRGPDRGIVQLFIDGQKAGSPVDTYLPLLTPGQPIVLGERVLEAGEHRIEMQVVGKNEKSQDYQIGLRGLDLVAKGLSRFPEKWNVIGPFDNTADNGYYTVYPPEEAIDIAAHYRGKNDVWVKWKTFVADSNGFLPLRHLYAQKSEVTAYAQTYIYSPSDTTAKILLGTDDGGKLWLNGELIWAMNTHRSAEPDQDRLWIRLKKGWNSVLIKVTQAQWDWGLYFRLEDMDGKFTYAVQK